MIKEARVTYSSNSDKEDIKFWSSKTFEERLSAVQTLREQYISLFNKQEEYDESRKRLLPEGTPSVEEFIELLNKHNVKYMIVGAYAFALYAKPRNTGDLDIFIERSDGNASLMMQVLTEFGLESLKITKDDFITEGRIIQLGVSPVRIDIMNRIDGVSFNEAFSRIEKVKFGDSFANFISKSDLIINKLSTNRLKDKADAEELQQS